MTRSQPNEGAIVPLRRRLTGGRWLRIAHRGDPLAAPGNSRAAIVAAAEAGVDLVEIDLHATGDGQLVLWHDPEIPVNGMRVPIARATLATLRAIDLGGGERIITLDEAIGAIGGRAGLLIDLKAEGLAEGIVAATRRRDTGPVVVCGHYWRTLRRIRRLAPEIGIAYTLDRYWRRPLGAAIIACLDTDAVSLNWRLVDAGLIRRCHSWGVAVIAWTVDDPALMGHLVRLGVDGVTSNRLDHLLATDLRPQPLLPLPTPDARLWQPDRPAREPLPEKPA